MLEKHVKVLLIEDNPDDVELLRALNADIDGLLDVTSVERLSEGLKYIEKESFDVVLLDFSLPDSEGIETLSRLYAQTTEVPIIVLTGRDDKMLANEALQKGAQDYLIKGQFDANLLYRSIRYAIERNRIMLQLKKLQMEREIDSLKHISGSSNTEITAQSFSIMPIKKIAPDICEDIIKQYAELLELALKGRIYKTESNISERLLAIAEQLGFLKAGPRDVVEIHTEVLEKKCRGVTHLIVQAYVEIGRIMLIELMGYVISFYRNHHVRKRIT